MEDVISETLKPGDLVEYKPCPVAEEQLPWLVLRPKFGMRVKNLRI